MAAFVGRKLIIKKNGTAVSAGVSKTITINNEPIDVTSDDDDGHRKLLEGAGEQGVHSVDISFEGVTKSDMFIADIMSGLNVDDYEVEIPGIGTLAGKFFLNSFSLTGQVAEGSTFTSELQSSGEVTFTPAAP